MQKDLIVFKLDDSKATNEYIKSIKKRDITIDVTENVFVDLKDIKNKYLASLVVKPDSHNKLLQGQYRMLVDILGDFNIEPQGIQYPIINTIVKIVEQLPSNKNVVIIGRSEELGIPLANELIRRDYIVTVVNSKNNNALTNAEVVINTAPIDKLLYTDIATVIDVAGTIKETNADVLINKIGKKMTMELERTIHKLKSEKDL